MEVPPVLGMWMNMCEERMCLALMCAGDVGGGGVGGGGGGGGGGARCNTRRVGHAKRKRDMSIKRCTMVSLVHLFRWDRLPVAIMILRTSKYSTVTESHEHEMTRAGRWLYVLTECIPHMSVQLEAEIPDSMQPRSRPYWTDRLNH